MKHWTMAAFVLLLSAGVFAQHDPGRGAVRRLARGDLDGAIGEVGREPRQMNSPISEGERHFVLTMAACLQGQATIALDHALKAMDSGVPLERFLAGPRDVLAPLYGLEAFQALCAEHNPAIAHGPMLGAVTDTSARFWVRTVAEAALRIQVEPALESTPSPVRLTGAGRTVAGRDYTATILVEGLEPDTHYQYAVFANDRQVGEKALFKTYPKPGASHRFQIVFGGGAGFTPMHERMWTTIFTREPAALLLLGDNVYIDDPEHRMSQRYCYYRRQSQPEWRRLIASTPVYAIYDDHDFDVDDCVPGPDVDDPPWKREVVEVFRQNWANPAYGGGDRWPGCWFDFTIGDVHFIVLDGRYYRDLNGGSMLGPVQKAWLFETLEASQGTFKILASPVPWASGVKPGSRDTWDGFPDEREEIFSFLEKRRIDGVALMAADRHRSDMRRIPRPDGYDLYEMMSSRLTNVHTHGLVQNARGSEFIMGYNDKCSFGLLDFNTRTETPQFTYRIVNIDNKVIDERTLTLRDLTHERQETPSP